MAKKVYKDDILDTSVNTRRKYNMIENADGTVSLEDATTYLQVGDDFGAADVNEIQGRMFASDGTEFRFGVNENGEYGYIIKKDGADTVIPFSGRRKYVTYKTKSVSNANASIDLFIYGDVFVENCGYSQISHKSYTDIVGLANLSYNNLEWKLTFLKPVLVNGVEYQTGNTITWSYSEAKEFEVVAK